MVFYYIALLYKATIVIKTKIGKKFFVYLVLIILLSMTAMTYKKVTIQE